MRKRAEQQGEGSWTSAGDTPDCSERQKGKAGERSRVRAGSQGNWT